MSEHEQQDGGGALVPHRASTVLATVMTVAIAKSRMAEFQQFCSEYLQESKDGGNDGGDYGVIPGTKKKTLLKSGADKLSEIYGLYDTYRVESKIEDWDAGLFDYVLVCTLKSRSDDSVVGTGVGSCSSFESKYRWRDAQRKCPTCGAEAIIKGKEEYGGGWLCWVKKDGCGAKFKDEDERITKQPKGRVENPDIIDAKNTVLKMAKKRAKIDAVIGVTRSSGVFTQDMEDFTAPVVGNVVEGHVVTSEPVKSEPVKADAPKTETKIEAQTTDAKADVLTNELPPDTAKTVGKVVRVLNIAPKTGGTAEKPWTLYIITFDQPVPVADRAGKTTTGGGTFDAKIAKTAEEAKASGKGVTVELVGGKNAGSYNVSKLALA